MRVAYRLHHECVAIKINTSQQSRAVTSETGHAFGMPKLVIQLGILWVVNGRTCNILWVG